MFFAHRVGARISALSVHPCPFPLPVTNSLQDGLTASVITQGSIWFTEARLLEREVYCHT